jgi:hypothetical protein
MLVNEKCSSGVGDEFDRGWSPSKRSILCLQAGTSSSYILLIVYFAFQF